MAAEIFIIPSPLSKDKTDILLEDDRRFVSEIKTFFVEDKKTARHHLKLLLPGVELSSLKMYVIDEHSKTRDIENLVDIAIKEGKVGLVSEAGYPAVADPGSKFIRLAHMRNIRIRPLWGASSIILALAGSGLESQKFTFNGYLPRQKSLRISEIKKLEAKSKNSSTTQIFIEAPYRNIHLWKDLISSCDNQTEVSVAVNLTGKDEFIKTAKAGDWKKMRWPDIDGIPTIFMLNAK